jgi:hypothetical protein
MKNPSRLRPELLRYDSWQLGLDDDSRQALITTVNKIVSRDKNCKLSPRRAVWVFCGQLIGPGQLRRELAIVAHLGYAN